MIEIVFEDEILREKIDVNMDLFTFVIDEDDNETDDIDFTSDIKKWFIDNNIDYIIKSWTNTTTTILFEKESDAILFKLTWL